MKPGVVPSGLVVFVVCARRLRATASFRKERFHYHLFSLETIPYNALQKRSKVLRPPVEAIFQEIFVAVPREVYEKRRLSSCFSGPAGDYERMFKDGIMGTLQQKTPALCDAEHVRVAALA